MAARLQVAQGTDQLRSPSGRIIGGQCYVSSSLVAVRERGQPPPRGGGNASIVGMGWVGNSEASCEGDRQAFMYRAKP